MIPVVRLMIAAIIQSKELGENSDEKDGDAGDDSDADDRDDAYA